MTSQPFLGVLRPRILRSITTSHPPSASKASPSLTRTLEVERKFVPSSPAMLYLKTSGKWPGPEPVEVITPPSGKAFTGVYYDASDFRLRTARIYVRRRNGEWQMKVRQSGDLIATGCIEVSGLQSVELALGEANFNLSLKDLGQVASMATTRRRWKVGIFTVVVDDITLLVKDPCGPVSRVFEIPHSVGEVELCAEIAEEVMKKKTQEMLEDIDTFMKKYRGVFGEVPGEGCGLTVSQQPEGKLAAFFRWETLVRGEGKSF